MKWVRNETLTNNTCILVGNELLELVFVCEGQWSWTDLLLKVGLDSIYRHDENGTNTLTRSSQHLTHPEVASQHKYLRFWDRRSCRSPLRPWRPSGSGSQKLRIWSKCCCWMCSPPWEKSHCLWLVTEPGTLQDAVQWTWSLHTLASGTMPLRAVAAFSYSGANRLQWPHL